MVEEDRFELPNPLGTDLQSAAFDHFAIPPDKYLLMYNLFLKMFVSKKMVDADGLEPPTHAL